MSWGELSALGCAVLWAIATILFKKVGEVVPPFLLNLFKNTLASLLFGITILLTHGLAMPAMELRDGALLMLSGVIGITFADAIFFRSLNLLGAGRSAIVDCLYSPFVILFSVLLLGDSLHGRQIFGFVLVLGGALLAGLERGPHHQDPAELRKGVWLGVLAMMLMAFAIVLIKPQTEKLSLLHVTEIRLVAGVFGALLVLLAQGRMSDLRVFRGPLPWKTLIWSSVIGAYGAMYLWMAGFKYVKSASTSAILNQTSVIFVIILAAIFLKERLDARKILGAVLAFAGVSLIFLQ